MFDWSKSITQFKSFEYVPVENFNFQQGHIVYKTFSLMITIIYVS